MLKDFCVLVEPLKYVMKQKSALCVSTAWMYFESRGCVLSCEENDVCFLLHFKYQ